MSTVFWRGLRLSLIATALLSLAGCDWVIFDSKGAVGIAERDLIIICVALMLIVVIPAMVLSFVFPWMFRSSNKRAKYTPNWDFSTKVEVVVWGIPLIIVVALSIIVWNSTHKLDPYRKLDIPGEPLHVDVIATDWKWVFVYPDLGIATVNELKFPAGQQLAFSITSNSTMNTFFIPQLGGQIYAMAGMRTQLHLVADEVGEFRGMSGNYSGAGFSKMHFKATALTNEDFEKWVADVRSTPNNLDFDAFVKLAEPSEGHPIEHFSNVEDGLFKKVIDQFIGVGENTRQLVAPSTPHSDSKE